MGYRPHNPLLDSQGRPLDDRVQQVLGSLVTRLQREFPIFRDEILLVEVLEEAGRRVADHERRIGQVERLRGYTWVTLRNVATSRMGRASVRLVQRTLSSDEGRTALSTLASDLANPEEIERDIFFREVLTSLTPDERMVCVWKMAGFSSREIARQRRSSAAAVDALFWRVKRKIREIYALFRRTATQAHEPRVVSTRARPLEEEKADKGDG